jgi:hypothetical protein
MGQLLVLLQHLRRIATSSAVDSVDLLTALLAIVTATTPTVITTIIIQGLFPQNPGHRPVPVGPICHTSHDHGSPPSAVNSTVCRAEALKAATIC